MTREEFIQIKNDMISAGWSVSGTVSKSEDPVDYGFRMTRDNQVFFLNVDSANRIPQAESVVNEELETIIQIFKEQFPWIKFGSVDAQQMAKLISGELVAVKISGTNYFELWKQSDIDSGKLDKRRAEIRAINRLNRQMKRDQEDKLLRDLLQAFNSMNVTVSRDMLENFVRS